MYAHIEASSMKVLGIGASIFFILLPNPVFAQSNEAIMRRLDSLENDNAALRNRVKQLESREKVNTGSPPLAPAGPDRDASEVAIASIPATKVDVTQYIPSSAVSVTMLVSVTPPTGTALIYTEGNENSPVIFKGPQTTNEIRLSGRFVYVKLIDATNFNIRYLNYRGP